VETEEEMADPAEVNKPRGGWRKRMIRRWYDANHELVHEDYQKDFEKFYVTVNARINDHRKVDKKHTQGAVCDACAGAHRAHTCGTVQASPLLAHTANNIWP
jgi:hypothetical protein